MTRQKIEIKKIDNLAARQVTFSKRRRGLFKKAHELATLCDADLALIVFSASGKLFDFSTSSMKELIRRHKMLPGTTTNVHNLAEPTSHQPENSVHEKLTEEFATKSKELRNLRGEELQGLGIEELKKLEKSLERGLSRVVEIKDEKFLKQISAAEEKEALLMEENKRLKSRVIDLYKDDEEQQDQQKQQVHGHYSLASNTSNSSSLGNPNSQDHDSSDISLKLRL